MDPQWVAFWIMLAILILFIIIGWIVRSYQIQRLAQATNSTDTTQVASAYQSEYLGVAVWGLNSPSANSARSSCHLYQLEGTATVPANPSLASAVLDSLTPLPLPGCYDLDQIVAAQVTHTCTEIDGLSTPVVGVLGCINSEGARVPVTTSETYYTQTALMQTGTLACTTGPCQSVLSLLAFNYHPNNGTTLIYTDALCLATSSGGSFTGQLCDLTDPDQLLRIRRSPAQVPGTTASTSQATTSDDVSIGKVGTLCSLYHRASGFYVDVDSGLSGLALSHNSEFIWALLRPMTGTTLSSPQQIVYVGTVSSEELSQFNGVLSFDSLIDLITSLGLLSIQLDGVGDLILAPFFTYPSGGPIPDAAWLASMMPVGYSIAPQVLMTTSPTNF